MRQQIQFYDNADFAWSIRWVGPSGPYQLSNLAMNVRNEPQDAAAILAATVANGRVVLGAAPDWWATILIPMAVVRDSVWPDPVAGYDVVATRSIDGRVRRLVAGVALRQAGYTR